MIPRKLAKRLLDEYLDRVRAAEEEDGDELDEDGLRAVAHAVLDGSDLVLRGAENVEQKARRYLTEGRVVIERAEADGGWVVAAARGSGNETYHLGYDPMKKQWRCTCPVTRGRCSHIAALRLIVTARGPQM